MTREDIQSLLGTEGIKDIDSEERMQEGKRS